ncbi:MAG: 30S ribosomal protein S4 [Candidatus Magasanikbacteria bacterium]|jgi:small subunit ribosomal protein S4|nr:30S ribosomal protein S4 [Candidatus Magasanikbacteria bacterium]MBT4221402.1 30S ribosomal protein S4 [Candidatus Magasanikbacteria bacterium]MBT4350750.1 30S ribosomal protein S4 [Candidatus Magasanikbacteria bacterium]MBT4541574.1 30S ribosomal protein S4 [Candidatus Magasanikbacteria bacterium]MBT6253526.1 30S ribosomal protein S4 [Candidatus Magasanikbacteria bacterium]
MGRYIGPKNKIARRFGINLWLKSNPAKVSRRLKQAPGVHGPTKRRKSLSGYGRQLAEKQKAKFVYGLREKQLRGYMKEANRRDGDSGVNLHQILESRLDNVVYRLGFAITRAQSRQFVSHNMFTVNGKKMNIPSYLVKTGDVIALKENKKKKGVFHELTERLSHVEVPGWLSVDAKAQTGKVLNTPLEENFEKTFDVKLIIEYYSTR